MDAAASSPLGAVMKENGKTTPAPAPEIAVAAIVHAEHGIVDGLLADFAFALRESGWRIRGLVQRTEAGASDCRRMLLVDLDGGECFPLSQNLGGGSISCCIDPGGVAAASVVLRRALSEGADLAIANRFGALEAEGGGFAAEMLALVIDGVPLLTVVAERHLSDWRHFTGAAGAELAPRLDALEAWFAGLGRKKEYR